MGYCQVIVDIAHERVDRVFTYRVPQSMALLPGMRVLVPFGPRKIEGYVVCLAEAAEYPEARIKDVLRPLEDYPALLPPLMALAQYIRDQAHCPLVEALRLLIPAQMRGERVREKTEIHYVLAFAPAALDEKLASNSRAPKRQRVLRALAQGPMTQAELAAQVPGPVDALRALVDAGLVDRQAHEVLRKPYDHAQTRTAPDPHLTPEQRGALQEVLPALAQGTGRFLLHGVTGSGKTEVYIRAVRQCLAMGKTAIVLVPEIALTPQMVDWFRGRFGQVAAVLHSRLTPGQRFDEWRRLRRGEARVVIGARSAVFAPVSDLGLVIVDEEHEPSYLSDRMPRYDARDVAEARGRVEGATVILASATPAMDTFDRAMRGELTLLEMPHRVLGRPMPAVHLVDMREELRQGNKSVFSGLLMEELTLCTRQGQQAMLFINRRGYNTFVKCRACGYVVRCAQCDISMTYHQDGHVMRCHYCGAHRDPPEICPACGSLHIRYFGAGTQMVEEAMRRFLPQVPVLRMDNDTTRTRDAHWDILQRFRQGDAQVLIGTQMIAKGLDFPNVTLVGVVAADATLNLPDYRAAERTFQLVTQVAGRAGRAEKPGTVVVQTYAPDHYCIQAAARQDYRAFFEEEMGFRRRQAYPPYAMLCRLLVEGEDGQRVAHIAQKLDACLDAFFQKRPALLRQVLLRQVEEAPVKVLRGKARHQVFLKLSRDADTALLDELCALALMDWPGAQVYAEINPLSIA
ncbi:MAG: primosomal protein N' [Oscillospiraceae bacterium]|nr:primosomal protein N' [Oscillospiraceae bacterium]